MAFIWLYNAPKSIIMGPFTFQIHFIILKSLYVLQERQVVRLGKIDAYLQGLPPLTQNGSAILALWAIMGATPPNPSSIEN